MPRVLMAVAAAVFVLSVTAPVQAQTIAFKAFLSGANEAPTGVTTGAFAEADVTWNMATRTLSWIIDVFNVPSGSTAAHFHVGGAGVAGPTVVNIAVPPQISNDFRLSGSATCDNVMPRAMQGINSCDDFEQAITGGQIYINLHTNNNPAGEIRGQVQLVTQF